MPDNNVTHEQLRAGQMALFDRFSDHEKHFRETTTVLFAKLDKAIDATHENNASLTRIEGHVNLVTERGTSQILRLDGIEATVKKLDAAHNQNVGERGVWAAIARNPVIAWVVTTLAALWAYLSHAGALKP